MKEWKTFASPTLLLSPQEPRSAPLFLLRKGMEILDAVVTCLRWPFDAEYFSIKDERYFLIILTYFIFFVFPRKNNRKKLHFNNTFFAEIPNVNIFKFSLTLNVGSILTDLDLVSTALEIQFKILIWIFIYLFILNLAFNCPCILNLILIFIKYKKDEFLNFHFWPCVLLIDLLLKS